MNDNYKKTNSSLRDDVKARRTFTLWVSSIYLLLGFFQLFVFILAIIDFTKQGSSYVQDTGFLLLTLYVFPLLLKGVAGIQLLRLKASVLPIYVGLVVTTIVVIIFDVFFRSYPLDITFNAVSDWVIVTAIFIYILRHKHLGIKRRCSL